jgi:YegS/Rv2252/BmrU family lipid kinase
MRIVAVVNPVSGAGLNPNVAGQRVEMIRGELSARGLTADVHLTERGGHARELAQRAADARADLVIVWGGDGTVNEIGGALAGSGTPLGLIPAGSGNGLAAALRVPFDPHLAIAVALGERTLSVDVGRVNGQPFFNVAGLGFDAHVAMLFNQRRRGRGGKLPYVVIGVREGCTYVGKEYRIALESGTGPARSTTVRALLIAFANGSDYGMGMRIAPAARLDDGLLEACVVLDRPVLSRFLHVRHLATGSIDRAPALIRESVCRAVVEADGDIVYHLDGELAVAKDRLDITVTPGALKVRVPPA